MSAYRSGNDRQHLLKQLKRAGRSDLLQAVQSGEVSVYAAAVEAGIRTRPPTLGLLPASRTRREHALHPLRATKDQEMWLGPSERGSVFASEQEQRAYWFQHRDRLMLLLGKNGRRPWAWWHYDVRVRHPGPDWERSVLWDLSTSGTFRSASGTHRCPTDLRGALTEQELAELEVDWRHEFDGAWCSGFSFTERPGEALYGAPARRRHYEWADIPFALTTAWTRERRSSAKQIRALRGRGAVEVDLP